MPFGDCETAIVQPGEALDFDIVVGPLSLSEEDSFLPQHPSMVSISVDIFLSF